MIYRIVLGWAKADSDSNAFSDAWSIILNALAGAWGTMEYEMVPNALVSAEMTKGSYRAFLDTSSMGTDNPTGNTVISLPTASSGPSRVLVETVAGGEVTLVGEYVVEEGATSVSVNLPAGRKLITVTGTARRI
jgi:hypothetical protein